MFLTGGLCAAPLGGGAKLPDEAQPSQKVTEGQEDRTASRPAELR